MAELGRAALAVTLGLSLYALVAGAAAAHLRRRRLALSAQNALFAALASTAVAAGVLLAALVRHDFSFDYVSSHTSRALPTGYTISAFWGGQEGSLLLWLLILTGFATVAVVGARRSARDLVAWVVPVFGAVATFFALLLVAVASPFATHAPPGRTGSGSTRASRTRTWSRTRRSSTSATSASPSRSRSRWARCSRAARTSAGSC